jgi:hypothetical protein
LIPLRPAAAILGVLFFAKEKTIASIFFGAFVGFGAIESVIVFFLLFSSFIGLVVVPLTVNKNNSNLLMEQASRAERTIRIKEMLLVTSIRIAGVSYILMYLNEHKSINSFLEIPQIFLLSGFLYLVSLVLVKILKLRD